MIVAGWWLACGAPPEAPAPAPAPPNVLLIVADDLGIDKVSAYGPGGPGTPRIDALAADGVRFETVWAEPSCSPARAALLTGRYPRRYGLGQWIDPPVSGASLPDAERTLPEVLGTARPAWDSALVGKWHLSAAADPDAAAAPLRQGFHHHRGSLANLRNTFGPRDDVPLGYDHWEKATDGVTTLVDRYATAEAVDDAATLLSTMSEPFFLMVALNLPHAPLHTPPEPWYDGPAPEDPAAVFDAMVRATDTAVGRVVDAIPADRRARTLVVFTSDNGTPEHGLRPPLDPTHGKETPFEAGVRVPLLISGPGVAEPGRVAGGLVHLVDLFPTVVELAGMDPDRLTRADGRALVLDGRTLVPTLRDPGAPSPHDRLFAEDFGPNGPPPYESSWATVRDRRYKLVDLGGRQALYDLGAALAEGPDLLAAGPLDPAADAALGRLRAELTRTRALAYEGP